MRMPPLAFTLAVAVTSNVTLAFSPILSLAADDNPSIEELLKTGW
jgi:hypothetical protein